MKSYPAVNPPARLSEHVRALVAPTDPPDIGTEDLGCHLCGAVFIRNATRDYLRRAGSVYCEHCHVWSQSWPPGKSSLGGGEVAVH